MSPVPLPSILAVFSWSGLLRSIFGDFPVHVIIPAACYLLGSVPFGLILCRLIKGVDIREHGSRNIGAANAGRVCGWPFFAATFAFDFAKGLASVVLGASIASWWLPSDGQSEHLELLRVVYGVCAILGHTLPVYLRFKGGKAVATGFGVFVALAPLPALIAFAVWALFFALFRYVSLASMLGAATAPLAFAALHWDDLGDHVSIFVFAIAVALLVLVRHRSNIRRLLAGTEPKFRKRKQEE